MNPVPFRNCFHRQIPSSGEAVCVARMTQRPLCDSEFRKENILPDCVDKFGNRDFHSQEHVKFLDARQAKRTCIESKLLSGHVCSMDRLNKPYGDIGERIAWHRALTGLDQAPYAAKAGLKRSQLSNWESGGTRLSLDGALALRNTYGLSLDFLFAGIADALPMNLRNAWIDRPTETS